MSHIVLREVKYDNAFKTLSPTLMHEISHMWDMTIINIIAGIVPGQNYESDTVLPTVNSVMALSPTLCHNNGPHTSSQPDFPSVPIVSCPMSWNLYTKLNILHLPPLLSSSQPLSPLAPVLVTRNTSQLLKLETWGFTLPLYESPNVIASAFWIYFRFNLLFSISIIIFLLP